MNKKFSIWPFSFVFVLSTNKESIIIHLGGKRGDDIMFISIHFHILDPFHGRYIFDKIGDDWD